MAHENTSSDYTKINIAKDFRLNMYEKYFIILPWTIPQSGQKWHVKTHAISSWNTLAMYFKYYILHIEIFARQSQENYKFLTALT